MFNLPFKKRNGDFDVNAIEASTAAEIIKSIETRGFAIKRGLLPPLTAAHLCDNARGVYAECEATAGEHPLMANRDYNTVKIEALDAVGGSQFNAIQLLMNTVLREVYDRTIGKNWIVSLDESPVFKANAGKLPRTVPTHWHQDACVNPYPTALVWIALSECGTDAPGLKLACKSVGEPIPLFLVEHGPDKPKEKYIRDRLGDVIGIPTFNPGDALFFNHLSIHGTYVTRDMTRDRISFKLTGVPHSFADRCARHVNPIEL